MKYTLELIKNTRPKAVFHIEATFMHGDADHYSEEIIVCDSEQDFFKKYKILKDRLDYKNEYHNAAIDSNNNWCEEHEEWLEAPNDITCGDGGWRASICGIKPIYYNGYGTKFKVIIDE